MTIEDLKSAELELCGSGYGCKSQFARLLGLKDHHSLSGIYRRARVPARVAHQVMVLRALSKRERQRLITRARTAREAA